MKQRYAMDFYTAGITEGQFVIILSAVPYRNYLKLFIFILFKLLDAT